MENTHNSLSIYLGLKISHCEIQDLTKMIIDFYIKSKTYNEKILNNRIIYMYDCPKCGSKHSWIRHAKYERTLVIQENNLFIDQRITILRLKCTACKSTHALLPGDIVPYVIHSFSCIIKLLSEYYLKKLSVLSIAKKYNLSFQLIYSFINRFIAFMNDCYSTLRILSIIKGIFVRSPKEMIKMIIRHFKVSDYPRHYAKINNWPYLMKKFRNIITIPIHIGFHYF